MHYKRMRFGAIGAGLATMALLAIATAHAQELRVTAANASNNQIYDVTFSGTGGYTTVLNTDQNLYSSIRSLVFIPNAETGKVDLLAADTLKGEIVRYSGASGAATVVWSTAMGPGPEYPNGLSVDAQGDLFVVSTGSGTSKPEQLWVFPHDPSLPLGAGFLAPRLVDDNFDGVPVQSLDDTLVATTTSPAAGPGDLLVLASNPDTVFVYSANCSGTSVNCLAKVISGGPPISPTRILLSSSDFPAVDLGGMAFWPADNSLLVTTSDGTILRYSFTSTSATRLLDFASGLGNGKFKIKTGIENGVPYAFVANNNGGQILKFGAPPATGGPNPPLAIVTTGVEHPEGLATTNLKAADAQTCTQSEGGCDLMGHVLKHTIEGPSALGSKSYAIEDICVVPVDPRIAKYGTCTGHTLTVGQVCAGYGNTVIPDYLCGGSGSSGTGFALVKTLTNSDNELNGTLVQNEAFTNSVLPGANLPCPQSVLAWAPLPGEGTIVEGNQLVEMTGWCGSAAAVTRQLSLWGFGLVMNMAALPGKNTKDKWVNYATMKYTMLDETISDADITSGSENPTFESILVDCVDTSQTDFDHHKYSDAANQLLACDTLVSMDVDDLVPTMANPNPSGEIRGRFANLYLTINTRLLGNPAPTSWPP